MPERKPIDPELRRFLDEQPPPPPGLDRMDNLERAQQSRQLMHQATAARTQVPGLPNQVASRDVTIANGLTARLYLPPSEAGPLPVLIYLHGGGWVVGSAASHHPFCLLLSEAAEVIICSVNYRLAPEHPYPAAVNDSLTAYRWAGLHAAEWNGDPSRLALGGDSAGGNLAAVAANRLCALGPTSSLRALLLLYPVTDHPAAGHPSYRENATGYGLEANTMRWFWNQYAPGISPADPDVSPLHIQPVPSLPPTLVATAEYDVLRDEGVAYGSKLALAGIAVTPLHAADMHHNFPVHPSTVARFPQSVSAMDAVAAWLRSTLSRAQTESA